MKLLSVDNRKSPITAKIELDCEVKGSIKRKAVTVRQGDDLSEKLSGYREDIRPTEDAKIVCGMKHFEELGNQARFMRTDSFQKLAEQIV